MLQTIRRKCRRRDERGAALVEFALLLPILMSLLLGTVTGGSLYNKKLAMTSASREGSRFGATLDGPTTAGWAVDVQKRTDELSSDVELSNICVKLVKVGSPDLYTQLGSDCSSTTPPANPSTAAAGDCLVKVWVRQPGNKLQAMFFSVDITLTTDSVSRYEGTAPGATVADSC